MEWRAHALIGAVCGFGLFFLLGEGIITMVIASVFAGLSALAPDLDHDMSKGRKWLDMAFLGLALMIIYGSACGAGICIPTLHALGGMAVAFLAVSGAYFLFFRFLKPRHRGITHTLAACFAFGILLFFITGKTLALAGTAGYASHLLADGHIKLV